MVRRQKAVLPVLIVALAMAASGCGGASHRPAPASPTSKPSASASPRITSAAPASPAPAGYKWVGSAAQGVWIVVPRSWAAINLAKTSVTEALSRFRLKGVSSSTEKASLAELAKRHAIVAADIASAVRSPDHFATNANAFCVQTPLMPNTGSSEAIKAIIQAEYQQIHAHVRSISTATINGRPGVTSTFTVTGANGMKITEHQYVVLAKDSRLCTITLSTDTPNAYQATFGKIGGSIHVS